MAYVTGNLNLVTVGSIGSSAGTKEYTYTTTDSVATFTAPGYISDAGKKGIAKGDVVNVVNLSTPSLFICQVESLTGTNYAATATLAVVAPLGSAAPARAFQQTVLLPLQLADIATGDFKIGLPFAFTIVSALFRTAKPASTAAKLATLTCSVNGTPCTGGAMALTTANQNAIGGTVAGSPITALNVGAAGNTIGVTASSVTAFAEGDGYVEFLVTNNDLAGAAA